MSYIKIMSFVMMGVAGLSFAAGRIMTNQSPTAPIDAPVAITPPQSADLATPPSIPTRVPDLIALPFVDTYRILKAAPPETIRSYCNELEQLPLGPKRNVALTTFFKTLIQANPVLTKELILQLKKDERWLPLSAIREAALPRRMESVAEVLLNFDRSEISGCSYDLLRETLDDWGKTEPLALKQFLEAHRGQDVEGYFERLVGNWAAYDPEAAREWMENEIQKRPLLPNRPMEDGGEEIFDSTWRYAVEGMMEAWVEGFLAYDPEAAVSYVLEHLEDDRVQRTLFSLAGNLFLRSPERARDFVLKLSGDLQQRSLKSIASKAEPLVRNDAADNSTSPRYVTEWLMRFPSETWKNSLGAALNTWEYAAPRDLFDWIAALPAETRPRVVGAFPTGTTVETAPKDFDSLMQAADLVLRQQLVEKFVRGANYAQAAVRAVVEKSKLPPEEKARLVSLLPARNNDAVETVNERTD